MNPSVLSITIDTREQSPWHFDESLADVRRGTLRTGDYAVTGDDGFAVERKSLDDFLGTISTGWGRFRRELARARKAGFVLVIIVEGTLSDVFYRSTENGIVPPSHNHPALSPSFVLMRYGEIVMRGGVPVFADDAFAAAGLAYSILNQRNLSLQENYYGTDDSREG